MTTFAGALERGRERFGNQEWEAAFAELSAADHERPLAPEDLVALATSAQLLGRDAQSVEFGLRAHQEFSQRGNAPGAARCAFWLSLSILFKGDLAQSGGWVARARRQLEDGGHDCVECGFLEFSDGLRTFFEGRVDEARARFAKATATGTRFRNPDLLALSRLGEGRALLRLGQTAPGVALLDEAMASVTSGEVSPGILGVTYCSVIDACHEIFDLRRAQEWTTALSEWCTRQPDMMPYRGECLVRRAELMQLHGAWPDAAAEAERARQWFSRPPVHRSLGGAFYQLAEIHRLRGETAEAEAAYRRASQEGRDPQPGLALLRLAQGQVDVARTSIQRAMEEARAPKVRTQMLPAAVEIALAAGDAASARTAADELAQIADRLDTPFLRAASAHAAGAIRLSEHDPAGALAALRTAVQLWRELEAPYDDARARVLIGLACRALADAESAELEFDAAGRIFEQLGAAPDRAHLAELSRQRAVRSQGGLTVREVEVLGCVATGATNRAIAKQLGLSEKTVARHLSNIFTKLGITSRAAATAYAFKQGLVRPPA